MRGRTMNVKQKLRQIDLFFMHSAYIKKLKSNNVTTAINVCGK